MEIVPNCFFIFDTNSVLTVTRASDVVVERKDFDISNDSEYISKFSSFKKYINCRIGGEVIETSLGEDKEFKTRGI